MTEDIPTVDGARTEAERRWSELGAVNGLTYPSDAVRAYQRGAFVAGAEWLAPTVAALEAEVARQTARAAAAEDAIDRALGALSGYDEHDDASPDAYDVVRRVIAALSDAAPQAVAAPEVVATRCGCKTNEAGDVRCHKCGQYVNIQCWNCRTPRGEGPCPNPVPATDGREGA